MSENMEIGFTQAENLLGRREEYGKALERMAKGFARAAHVLVDKSQKLVYSEQLNMTYAVVNKLLIST